MMVKEERVFITSDGKEYKTKKSAERHENEVLLLSKGYTKKAFDGYLKELAKINKIVRVLSETKPDWRDWNSHLVGQLPEQIENLKNDVVNYVLVETSIWSKEPKVKFKVSCPRVEDGELPKEIEKYLTKLTEDNKDGTLFKAELYEEKPNRILYKLVKEELTPEVKMSKGIQLKDDDIAYMLAECPVVHEIEGEDRRWSRSVTTVVKAEDGNLYAIDWEKGLTENQENEYYEQPKKVTLEEREVVTKVIDINYI